MCRWEIAPDRTRYWLPDCFGGAVYGKDGCTCKKESEKSKLESEKSKLEKKADELEKRIIKLERLAKISCQGD